MAETRMTAEHTIDYEALTQDAMRGVVRAVLMRAAKSGLPGDHHFFISFDTQAPGVILSKRLKETPKYQSEMTIVLQHRFWDLAVNDERFEVKLTFDGIPERLVVPFSAMKFFFDPSVRFGLQFEEPEGPEGMDGLTVDDPQADAPVSADSRATTTRSQGPRKPRTPRKSRADRDVAATGDSAAPKISPPPVHTPGVTRPAPPPRTAPNVMTADANANPPEPKPAAPVSSGAQIVSLDQFRKK